MKRRHDKRGQAVVEYAFLLILLATITVAVVIMAGNQLASTYSDLSYEFTHLGDTSTLAPDGTTTLPPGTSPSCPMGTTAVLYGHKWKCKTN